MCSTTSPRTSGHGWKRCAPSSRTTPSCWRKARMRASRTRCISPCRPRDSLFPRSRKGPTSETRGVIDQSNVMGFTCGILGLSNVGKSTVFNALTATAAAQASNYPFSTVEPLVGEVLVPDPRLDTLAKLAKSAKIKPTRLSFVDIAGLVSGSSRGEGLGNQFLAHVREVDAIAHVVRCFEDKEIAHVSGAIDPIADIDTIETELMLADLESLERRADGLGKKAKGSDREAIEARETLDLANRALVLLREGRPARLTERKPEEEKA